MNENKHKRTIHIHILQPHITLITHNLLSQSASNARMYAWPLLRFDLAKVIPPSFFSFDARLRLRRRDGCCGGAGAAEVESVLGAGVGAAVCSC